MAKTTKRPTWPNHPFIVPEDQERVAKDQPTIDAVKRVITDWDGENWDAVREHLLTMGRTEQRLRAMTVFDVRMAYATGHGHFIATSGQVSTNACEFVTFGGDEPAPLSDTAAIVYEILLALPVHRALTGRNLVDELAKQSKHIDENTLTTRIIPELKPYGIKNKPRIGYYIPPDQRK